jgi:hypothetical protein
MRNKCTSENIDAYKRLNCPEILNLLESELEGEKRTLVTQIDPVMLSRSQGKAQYLTELISEIKGVKT